MTLPPARSFPPLYSSSRGSAITQVKPSDSNHALNAWFVEHRPSWKVEIQSRPEGATKFKPERKRWVVERTFAWIGRNRRLAKDFERTIASAEAWFFIASVRLLCQRLARA